MPTYDYRCDTNGQVLEVSHRMSEPLSTWGELCSPPRHGDGRDGGRGPGPSPGDRRQHHLQHQPRQWCGAAAGLRQR